MAIGAEGLLGTGALATLVDEGTSISDICDKAVVRLRSKLSTGVIDDCALTAVWQGYGTSYAIPAFPFDASASTLRYALETLDRAVLGEVWVSRGVTTSAAGGVWNVTFIENAQGRTPEVECGSDAEVSQVVNASCEGIGGVFALKFDGNVTRDIAYNASESEVRQTFRRCACNAKRVSSQSTCRKRHDH